MVTTLLSGTAAHEPTDVTATTDCDLTVCVIGCNQADRLDHVGKSLQVLQASRLRVERVYVDSASTDDSASVAKRWFDRVLVLADDRNLCASAGRHVGTRTASGACVLYLDGDMTLEQEFIPTLERFVFGNLEEAGVVGRCVDVFEDGRKRFMFIKGNSDGEVCRLFGGAVVLRRKAVLDAGNWDPRIFSNEEAELYTRLLERGEVVRFANISFVRHHTKYISPWRKLLQLFVPGRRGLGKKYWGPGQVIAARASSGTLLALFRWFPYPFVFLSGVTCSVVALFLSPVLALLFGAASLGYIHTTCGWRLGLVYLAWVPQVIGGLWKFDRAFVPTVAVSWSAADRERESCRHWSN